MKFKHGYALVIGIGTYQFLASQDVPPTVEDARSVAAVLQDPNFCGYPQNQVQVLVKEQATRKNILKALDRLATTTADDTVFVFYSGHGEYGSDGFYLTTYDTQMIDDNVVAGTGIREVELLERLRKVPARRALLIFNACHSGQLSPSALGKNTPSRLGSAAGQNLPNEVAVALLGSGEGRVIITACREDQLSYFVPTAERTFFADALTSALRGEGLVSRHGYISVFDLYDYVFSNISTYIKQTWRRVQEPMLTISRGVGVMAVALYRGSTPTVASIEQLRPLGGVVREVEPAESLQTFQQIMSGQINLAAQRDITVGEGIGQVRETSIQRGDFVGSKTVQGDEIRGDKLDARGAQGFVNKPSGPVTQSFGSDQRKGIFESEFSNSTVVGVVEGNATFGAPPSGAGSTSLSAGRAQVEHALHKARARGANDLADDLESVITAIDAALKAEREGKPDRRQAQIRKAQQSLHELARLSAELGAIAQLLR